MNKLTILGCGSFFVTEGRSSSSYLLEVDNKKILIDCGPGTLMRLSKIGVKPEDLDYIFITHFHADHTADLFPLFMNVRLSDFFGGGKITKFPIVIGPKGIYKFILKLSKIYGLPAVEGWSKVKFQDNQKKLKIGKIEIESHKVNHIAFGKKAEAYSYRFKFNGTVLSFSGDSTDCKGIRESSKNADLFLCDTSYSKGNSSTAHMDTAQIGEICQTGKVKKVILTHQYPQNDSVDLVSEVREKFAGKIVLAKDLEVLDLSSR